MCDFAELLRIFKFRVFVRHFCKLTPRESPDIWMIQRDQIVYLKSIWNRSSTMDHSNGSTKWIIQMDHPLWTIDHPWEFSDNGTSSDISTHESIFWHFLTTETKKSRIFFIFINSVFLPVLYNRELKYRPVTLSVKRWSSYVGWIPRNFSFSNFSHFRTNI